MAMAWISEIDKPERDLMAPTLAMAVVIRAVDSLDLVRAAPWHLEQ